MADNLFVPFHRSYRLSTIMTFLAGMFGILFYTHWRNEVDLKEKLEQCEQAVTRCEADVSNLDSIIHDLQIENAGHQEKLQIALYEIESMRENVAELENQVGEFKEKWENAVNQNKTDQIRIVELKSALNENQTALDDLVEESHQLYGEIKLLKIKLSGLTALSNVTDWISRRWQVTSALLFAGLVAPAALLGGKLRKFKNRAAKRLPSRPKSAGSAWMMVSRSEAKTISQQRRAH